MNIYRATKQQFVEDVFNNTIADNIDEAFYEHLGRHTSPNEVRSWQNSMQFMYKVVDTPELPDDAGVAIEYQIPLTAKRVDFIVSGLNAQKKEQIIIIIPHIKHGRMLICSLTITSAFKNEMSR